jgi:hypothetical protein
METIITSINLLKAVYATMDGIPVIGIENQEKFVGSANAIQTIIKALDAYAQKAKLDEKTNSEGLKVETDG